MTASSSGLNALTAYIPADLVSWLEQDVIVPTFFKDFPKKLGEVIRKVGTDDREEFILLLLVLLEDLTSQPVGQEYSIWREWINAMVAAEREAYAVEWIKLLAGWRLEDEAKDKLLSRLRTHYVRQLEARTA